MKSAICLGIFSSLARCEFTNSGDNWIWSMCKKLSLLLLLLCSSCNHSPIERAAQSQPLTPLPNLAILQQADRVEIQNDWNGYSDITPILRHYKLRLERQKFSGNAHIAIGGYGAAGIHQQQTTKVIVPAAASTKFLAILAKTPLEVGAYRPRIDRGDDYPSVKIQLQIDRQQVTFSSQSQAVGYVPWKVTITKNDRTTEYISNSALPAQALQSLDPYLNKSGIDRIIQRRREKK
jgi:hypothetical protein